MGERGFRGVAKITILQKPPRVASGTILVGEVGREEEAIRADDSDGTVEIVRKAYQAIGLWRSRSRIAMRSR